MPAYMIIQAVLTDPKKFQAYTKVMPDLITKFGGRYVLTARHGYVLEGDWGDGASAVISEWPDQETAKRFWNSPEYENAKTLRQGTGQFHVLLVDSQTPIG